MDRNEPEPRATHPVAKGEPGATSLATPSATSPAEPPPEAPLPPEVADYLSRIDSGLDLPAHVRAEIADEMADHFRDSIAAITAEGLEPERAAREAMARLGSPTELAAELTRAHRTTRRLLAGAAGGVFHATVGAAGGMLLGIAIVTMATCAFIVVAGTVLQPLREIGEANLPALRDALHGMPMLTTFLAWAACVGAYFAARRGVAASIRLSRRSPAAVRRIWAVLGFGILTFAVIFLVPAYLNLLSIVSLLAIPAAFAAGALMHSRPRISVGRWKMLGALAMVVILGASYAVNTPAWRGDPGNPPEPAQGRADQLRAFDRVAPAWAYDAKGLPFLAEGGGLWGTGVITQDVGVFGNFWAPGPANAAALAQFTDIRFEAWRAIRDARYPSWAEWIPDPAYSAPYATAPAQFNGGSAEVQFNVGNVRTTDWLVFVTATAPDGHRYRLNEPEWNLGGGYLQSCFTGTIWQWLTAGA